MGKLDWVDNPEQPTKNWSPDTAASKVFNARRTFCIGAEDISIHYLERLREGIGELFDAIEERIVQRKRELRIIDSAPDPIDPDEALDIISALTYKCLVNRSGNYSKRVISAVGRAIRILKENDIDPYEEK